jgi:hypothetical protein
LLDEQADKPGSGAAAELAVDAAQMELHRLGAQKQRGGDVAVGLPIGHQPGDLELLGGEPPGYPPGWSANGRPSCLQLCPRLLSPGVGIEVLEGNQCRPQALPRRRVAWRAGAGRSLPNARRRTPSRSPPTSPSAAGPRPSPTHASAGPEVEIAGELVGPIPRGTFASGDWRRDSRMPSIGSEGSGRGA